MSRRGNSGERAAQAASDAARVLQARSQEARSEPKVEQTEPTQHEDNARKAEVRAVTPRNEPRRRAMEEIEARDLKSKGLEIEEEKPAKVEAPKVEAEPAAKAEPEAPDSQETSADAPVAEAATAVPETPKTVRVKVDGEEFDVPQTEIDEAGGVAAYRILRAQENRLKKANEALAETRRVQAAMVQWAQQQQAAAQPRQPEVTPDQFIASKLDEIRFGTPEQGAAALMEVMQRTTKQIDPNSIIEQAANRIKHDQAVAAFDQEFSDLASNQVALTAVVALRNQRIAKVNGPIDWHSFYRTIGNEVRSAFGRPSQPATAPAAQAASATSGTPSQAPSEKEARKASIVNLPTAAARAELPKDSKPESREDVLQEMRKRRGLPTG